VGSSCHLKGAYGVIEEIKRLIDEGKFPGKVELQAGFCLDNCRGAVNIKVEETIISGVSPANVKQHLDNYLKGNV
jgi:NADH:ubiquinone oxidoreductase subunit E